MVPCGPDHEFRPWRTIDWRNSLTFQGPEDELDRLRHPSEALATVLAHTALLPTEPIPLVESSGRILAADFIASADFPPFPASTMDGYAVIADDGSPWRDVVGVQAAGQLIDAEVTPGTAIKIMTGAPAPERSGRGGQSRKHRNRR